MPRVAPVPAPDPPLADAVVALRPWTDADLAGKLVTFGDPLVQRFSWPLTRPYTEADARAYLAEQRRAREQGRGIELAILEPADPGTVLGGVSLFDLDRAHARGSIGYWLGAQGRGRGAATHAVRLLAAWGFARLALERIELTCAPDNERSQRVAERCGFTREGVLRSHQRFKGARRDTVVHGLLPGELR